MCRAFIPVKYCAAQLVELFKNTKPVFGKCKLSTTHDADAAVTLVIIDLDRGFPDLLITNKALYFIKSIFRHSEKLEVFEVKRTPFTYSTKIRQFTFFYT